MGIVEPGICAAEMPVHNVYYDSQRLVAVSALMEVARRDWFANDVHGEPPGKGFGNNEVGLYHLHLGM